MRLQEPGTIFLSSLKTVVLFVGLYLFVLWVNSPFLSFDMMYFEQPILYLVNQQIKSVHDLVQIYLHPQLLDALSIPFFRPSGHFLLYQLITQFTDWHNTKGFLAVNFLFLALSCCLMIRLYALFFPRYAIGGYIACGIYLMHPALLLSRLAPMHFEYACVFFLLLGLYCFALFCKKNISEAVKTDSLSFNSQYLLAFSLVFYFISVTFKEVALMLGPVMALYFVIALYQGQPYRKYWVNTIANQDVRKILLLLIVATFTLMAYLLLAWQVQPMQGASVLRNAPAISYKFFQILFGFGPANAQAISLSPDVLLWEKIIFPPQVQWVLWIFGVNLLLCVFFLYVKYRSDLLERKAFLFLTMSFLAFIIMPIIWGRARPWHLALSLIFLSMMMGFAFEYLCHLFFEKKFLINPIGFIIAIVIGMIAIPAGTVNINFIKTTANNFALQLDRNAVLYAPAIRNQLDKTSVLVVEDSTVHSDYLLGDSIYPFELYGAGADIHRLLPNSSFYVFPYVYGGTLFRWAYLMPSLKEQVYPFQIDKMQAVSTVTIYNWLQHYNNIFCVGYDDQANWHDRTSAFKKNLLIEQARRHLVVNQYRVTPTTEADLNSRSIVRLPFSDVEYCKFKCDSDKHCKAFAYVEKQEQHHNTAYCYFHTAVVASGNSSCQSCQTFIKL